jgi:hydrogenase expression/formation protein HypC
MCLSIPSKIVSIDTEHNRAQVDTMGVSREVSLDLMAEPPAIGDYVLIHIGFAMNKIDEADALESIQLFEQLLAAQDESDQAAP